MKVTTTKNTSPAGKAVYSPREKRFNQAWKRVADQQKENDRFREYAQAFVLDTRTRIQDKEQAYVDAMYAACLHLVSFLSRKSLTLWQRETLATWVGEYLSVLESHPFGSHLNTEPIRKPLVDAFVALYPDLQPPPEGLADDLEFDDLDSPLPGDEDFFTEEMFQELMAEFEQPDKAGGPGQQEDDADADQAFFNGFFQEQRAYEQQRQDESQALKQLMKSSSVNKLFRKVAGVLHPDKELDETVRRDKNRLMGELIQARDTNDIPRIFAFYTEYIGHSPLKELGEDLDGVTQLLERQYLYLCDLKERILDEDPVTSAVYRRFHRKTPAATQRTINKHLKDTQDQIRLLQALPQDITSLKDLKPYLEFRYEQNYQDEVFGFM